MFFEVFVVEVRVHVESGQTKVEGARDVRDNALTTLPHTLGSHPHIPVPMLQEDGTKDRI